MLKLSTTKKSSCIVVRPPSLPKLQHDWDLRKATNAAAATNPPHLLSLALEPNPYTQNGLRAIEAFFKVEGIVALGLAELTLRSLALGPGR